MFLKYIYVYGYNHALINSSQYSSNQGLCIMAQYSLDRKRYFFEIFMILGSGKGSFIFHTVLLKRIKRNTCMKGCEYT